MPTFWWGFGLLSEPHCTNAILTFVFGSVRAFRHVDLVGTLSSNVCSNILCSCAILGQGPASSLAWDPGRAFVLPAHTKSRSSADSWSSAVNTVFAKGALGSYMGRAVTSVV